MIRLQTQTMTIRLSQQHRELIYSIFLILLIPAFMIGSTVWLTSQFKNNFDQELRLKANLANEVFGVSVVNALQSNTVSGAAASIQSQINQTIPNAPEIDLLSVAVPKGSGFDTIASSETSLVNTTDTSPQTQFAWDKQTPVASLISAGEAGVQDWVVATPVFSESNHPLAVTVMRVSSQESDNAINQTLRTAFIILSIMTAIIVLLLLNHFRFVEYAELFRKQKELDQMKDDFISIATHELKAPMTVIKGYLSMTLEMKLPKEPRDMVKIAFDQTDRLGRLVTDLLDVSRIEQGRTKYNLTSVDIAATIAPMMGTFEVKAMDKKLKLDYQKTDNLPNVTADPDRVTEIFTNLIDNAIKYSNSGTVIVSHVVTPTSVDTSVRDTGIGMTQDEQSRLFQRFYRAKNADTKDIPGTGLGLWIIKQYIEHMGGTIRVDSEKGKGTAFIVSLPRTTSAAPESD
jgi:signal transduction histidine kinase